MYSWDLQNAHRHIQLVLLLHARSQGHLLTLLGFPPVA
jgi:hypothetical protein